MLMVVPRYLMFGSWETWEGGAGSTREHNLASKEHWVPKKYGPRVRHDISEYYGGC